MQPEVVASNTHGALERTYDGDHHVLWVDRRGVIQYVGAGADVATGVGRSIADLSWLTAEGQSSLRGLITLAIGGPAVGQLRARLRGGSTLTIEARAVGVRLPDGAPGTLLWIGPSNAAPAKLSTPTTPASRELREHVHTLSNVLAVISWSVESMSRVGIDGEQLDQLADITAATQRASAVLRLLQRNV